MIRLLRLCSRTPHERGFHTSNRLLYFYEPKDSGFKEVYDNPPPEKNLSLLGRLREGYQQFKFESSLLAKEARDVFRLHKTFHLPNENHIVWKFDGSDKCLNQWVTTCDQDYKQGFSTAKLELSPTGTGIFHGTLSTRVPKDGVTGRAGYCNITTVRKLKSFKRKDSYDWSQFNSLVLRVRGDGRCYMINILQRGPVDITWYMAYHYVLYTRGGPYWQYIQIPFSKFVFGSKGVIQDQQKAMEDHTITNFGITVGDNKNGPFKLEIDYIGVRYDVYNFETFAYELYDISKKD